MPFKKGTPKPPTSGVKKGYKYPQTLERERVLEAMRAHIMSQVEPMIAAQLEHAKGVSYVMLRRPDGTYARATDVKQLDAAAAALGPEFGATIFTQAPNVQAFQTLTDRAFGRPTEHTEMNVTVTHDLRDLLARRGKKPAQS